MYFFSCLANSHTDELRTWWWSEPSKVRTELSLDVSQVIDGIKKDFFPLGKFHWVSSEILGLYTFLALTKHIFTFLQSNPFNPLFNPLNPYFRCSISLSSIPFTESYIKNPITYDFFLPAFWMKYFFTHFRSYRFSVPQKKIHSD